MKLRRILSISAIALLSFLLCTGHLGAAKKQSKSTKLYFKGIKHFGGTSALGKSGTTLRQGVKLMDLSPAVRKHVLKHVGSGRMGTIIKVVKNGNLTYELTFKRDGVLRHVTLDGSGQLVKPAKK